MREKEFDGSQGRPNPDGASQMTADSPRRPPPASGRPHDFSSHLPPPSTKEWLSRHKLPRSAVKHMCAHAHTHTQAQDRKDLLVLVLLR